MALAEAEKLKTGYTNLVSEYSSYNTLQSDLLRDKNTTVEQFSEQTADLNAVRTEMIEYILKIQATMEK